MIIKTYFHYISINEQISDIQNQKIDSLFVGWSKPNQLEELCKKTEIKLKINKRLS